MKIFLFLLMVLNGLVAVAQREYYDIAIYTAPKHWKKETGNSLVMYSRTDGGSWAQMGIYKGNASLGNIEADIDAEWKNLVLSQHTITDKYEKGKPQNTGKWTAMSRSGVWQYKGSNVATILTTYSNGSVCFSTLLNATAQPYMSEYEKMLASLSINEKELKKYAFQQEGNKKQTDPSVANNFPLVGLWVDYSLETTGNNMNGIPQYTAGYLRKEYAFYKDGTYTFRNKQWITKANDILFVYETGTWAVKGNQLVISPKNGKGTFWKKKASSVEWGEYVKDLDYKLEQVTYTFKIIEDPNYSNTIILNSTKPTQRDGGKFNAPNEPYAFHYSFRKLPSAIDNPPGN